MIIGGGGRAGTAGGGDKGCGGKCWAEVVVGESGCRGKAVVGEGG